MARYDFLDWLKAIGITFVVYGHVAHATTVPLTPPIYLKQFGVICFLFATTFMLARDTRPTAAVVFARLFPIFLFGLSTAAVLSLCGALAGTSLLPSNYLPFTLGANVAFNHFPANPSTWYLGTYIHLMLLWAIFRASLQVRLWMVFVALLIEVPVRAALVTVAGPYVAYMALTNWLAVCVYGLWCGSTFDMHTATRRLTPAMPAACAMMIAVALSARVFAFDATFPFMSMPGWSAWASATAVSSMASALYLAAGVTLFELTRRIHTTPRLVAFLARNSLLVFLVHMPVYFALRPVLIDLGFSYEARAFIQFLVCLPLLALLSEVVLRLVPVKALASRAASLIESWRIDLRKPPAPLAQER